MKLLELYADTNETNLDIWKSIESSEKCIDFAIRIKIDIIKIK